MRKNRLIKTYNELSILTLDDDEIMTLTLQSYFQSSGYNVDVENDPSKAIERIRNGKYDILLLDFLMNPICGDEVVRRIREFNNELYIILLTGHKSLAPPIKTIRELDIQGYYEKSDRFDQLELLVESCVKSIRQMRTIRGYRDGLKRIVDANPDIYKLQSIDVLLSTLLDYADKFFNGFNGFIYLDSPRHFAQRGGYSLSEAEALYNGDTQNDDYSIVPLVNERHETFGLFAFALTQPVNNDTLALFDLYARQASSAISNVALHDLVNSQNDKLQHAYSRLGENYMAMVNTVRSMVDARDIYTRGHSDRVSDYAVRIARAMRKDDKFIERIRVAGLFHDIGKISIPDSILLKNDKLTDIEFEEIKMHPERGARMLAAVSLFNDIAPIIEAHHERIDGGGYPRGLCGNEIPEESRIISVADAFDAMTSHRRYRQNLSVAKAIEQLIEGKGEQFDTDIVDVFIPILTNFDEIQRELAWTYTGETD